MPDVGLPELLIILVVVVLLFGPARLTEVMAALGKGVREFRTATHDNPAGKNESDSQDAEKR